MKKIKTTLLLILLSNLLYAQNPLVKQWDKRFGAIGNENIYALQQTIDRGYILGGISSGGVNGDKTQPAWNNSWDYWIIKIDSLGINQWNKRFGGTEYDYLTSLQQTADGGYILGGYSHSGISGDKTQPNWDTSSSPSTDYWIVKTDSLGIKQWDKRFGGTYGDNLYSLQQTSDKGYILGGYSQSGITGDKTQPTWGSADYWIVKTDSLGIKQWDKRFGGYAHDQLNSIQQTPDAGFILAGWSSSGISGDKTQPSWGSGDYWVVKIDSLGTKQWDKRFGGLNVEFLNSLKQTIDRGFILGGLSSSAVGGDKTQPNWDTTLITFDYWIVKIDSAGNKQWDRDFGTPSNEDEFGNIEQTFDAGYLLYGTTYSQIAGDKTENNLGLEQSWIVKTDSTGSKQWDKTIFTLGHDEEGFAIQTQDGCYTIVNITNSGIGGYKTQPNWDLSNITYDYWIIKFCDTTAAITVNEIAYSGLIEVYPNPFADDISVAIQKQNLEHASFIIKNILGQTIFSIPENSINSTIIKTIDLRILSKGIYVLEIIIDGERTVKKIVKE